MARDKYHELVKNALIKEGWNVTHDPLFVKLDESTTVQVDLGAERLLAAEKAGEKIAVEIKTFLGHSLITNFYHALGQFELYLLALENQEPDRKLFLAISTIIYRTFFQKAIIQQAIKRFKIKLIVYNIEKQTIDQWIR